MFQMGNRSFLTNSACPTTMGPGDSRCFTLLQEVLGVRVGESPASEGPRLGATVPREPPAPAPTAEPRFSNVFQSHMVLQRHTPIRLWGPGPCAAADRLSVAFGAGHAVDAECTATGSWAATLPAQGAANGTALSLLRLGSNVHQLDDVAVGDVFLFSGQSNIDIPESYGHQFNASAQSVEEQLADALGAAGLVRFAIVPNQVGGLSYNTTLAAE